MIQKLKKSNAGFTLVELIVVIAILGVLAAVLVPQYIQYVDKAKISADKNACATVEQAIGVLMADGTITGATGNGSTGTVTLTSSTGALTVETITGLTATNLGAITGTIPPLKSSKAPATIQWTVTYVTGSTPTLTCNTAYTGW